jgi:hypothetical protein
MVCSGVPHVGGIGHDKAVTVSGRLARFAIVLAAGSISFAALVGDVNAAQEPRANAPSWFTTPFGIVYKK